MSEIRHDVLFSRGDCRNASADGKVQASKPNDDTRLCIAISTDSSSSTIETIRFLSWALITWPLLSCKTTGWLDASSLKKGTTSEVWAFRNTPRRSPTWLEWWPRIH